MNQSQLIEWLQRLREIVDIQEFEKVKSFYQVGLSELEFFIMK